MGIKIAGHSYKKAVAYFYTDKSDFKKTMNDKLNLSQSFKDSKGQVVTKSLAWFDHISQVNTCALRVSYALWASGAKFDGVRCKRFIGTFGKQKVILPSVAAEYKAVLDGEIVLKKYEQKIPAAEVQAGLKKKSGIILFSGGMSGATGHVTFYGNGTCVDIEANKYFAYTSAIYFWAMKP